MIKLQLLKFRSVLVIIVTTLSFSCMLPSIVNAQVTYDSYSIRNTWTWNSGSDPVYLSTAVRFRNLRLDGVLDRDYVNIDIGGHSASDLLIKIKAADNDTYSTVSIFDNRYREDGLEHGTSVFFLNDWSINNGNWRKVVQSMRYTDRRVMVAMCKSLSQGSLSSGILASSARSARNRSEELVSFFENRATETALTNLGHKCYTAIRSLVPTEGMFVARGENPSTQPIVASNQPQSSAQQSSNTSPTNISNSSAELKNVIQPMLSELGLYSGAIDGIIGPKTRAAIKEFEWLAGRTQDGYMDDQDIASLTRAFDSSKSLMPSLIGNWSGRLLCDTGSTWTARFRVNYSQEQHDYVARYGHAYNTMNPPMRDGISVTRTGLWIEDTIQITGRDQNFDEFNFSGTLDRDKEIIHLRGSRGGSVCNLILVPTSNSLRIDAVVQSILEDSDAIEVEQVSNDQIEAVQVSNTEPPKDLTPVADSLPPSITKTSAENLVSDLESFVSDVENVFGTELVIKYGLIREFREEGRWDDTTKTNFAEFMAFVLDNEEFAAYHQQKNNDRAAAQEEEVQKLQSVLNYLIVDGEIYMQQYPFSTQSEVIFGLIEEAHKFETSENLDDLASTVRKLSEAFTAQGVPFKAIDSFVEATELTPEQLAIIQAQEADKEAADEAQRALEEAVNRAHEAEAERQRIETTAEAERLATEAENQRLANIEETNRLAAEARAAEAEREHNQLIMETARQEAPTLIGDVETFVNNGIGQFDRKFATLYQQALPSSSGVWTEPVSTAYLEFEKFVMANEDFKNYHQEENRRRSAERLALIETTQGDLRGTILVLGNWVDSHLLDANAVRVLQNVEESKTLLNSENIAELTAEVEKLSALMDEIGIQNELGGSTVSINDQSAQGSPDSRQIVGDTFTMYANLTGRAKHAYKDISGNIAYENNEAEVCVSDTIEIDDETLFYLKRVVLEKTRLPDFQLLSDCSDSVVETADLVIVSGRLISSSTTQYSALREIVNSSGFDEISSVTKDEILALKSRDTFIEEGIIDDLNEGVRSGFGAVVFGNGSSSLCYTPTDNTEAHLFFIDAMKERLELMSGGRVNVIIQTDLNNAFRQLQREQCGVIYSDAESLGQLFRAASQNLGLEPRISPEWISLRQIQQKQTEISEADESANVAEEMRQREIEQQKRLEAEAQQAAIEEAVEQQKELQAIYNHRFEGLVNAFKPSLDALLDYSFEFDAPAGDALRNADEAAAASEYEKLSFANTFEPLEVLIQGELNRKWEEDARHLSSVDYGVVDWNNRNLEGLILELELRLKNRLIGEYKTQCVNFAYVWDEEFQVMREAIVVECENSSAIINWKRRVGFQSRWLVDGTAE